MAKLYSFRYPYNLTAVFEPWRKFLRDGYDKVVADLTERDRLLEDHLNLGVGQGYLANGVQPAGGYSMTAVDTTVTGMTATFTVPDNNRYIKLTAHAFTENVSAPSGTFSFTRILEDGATVLTSQYRTHGAAGAVGGQQEYNLIFFYTPTKGTHTVEFQVREGADNIQVAAIGTGVNFLSVEDVGPTIRT